MSNQTIDGVPRELIEKAMLACFEAGFGIPHAELRALLEAPAAPTNFEGAAQYWSENEQALRDVCRFEGLKGLVYQVVRDCAKPAAQPQGEPVAYQRKSKIEGSEWHYIHGCDVAEAISMGFEVRPLYAEQPAPVAVVTPERILEADVETLFQEGKRVGWNGYDDEMRKRMNNG